MDSNINNLGFTLTAKVLKIASNEQIGFRFGDKGTHTSRTIMLKELSTLLQTPAFC
jgi:hypothetical protein